MAVPATTFWMAALAMTYWLAAQGADTLIGGAGDQDAASYQDALLGVIVNLALGGTGGEAAGDTYSGVEYVYGSAYA